MKKNHPKQITLHHRCPVSLGGKNEPRNISKVTRETHEAFHLLFGNGEVNHIAEQLNDVWCDPKFAFLVVERSKIHNLSKTLK